MPRSEPHPQTGTTEVRESAANLARAALVVT